MTPLAEEEKIICDACDAEIPADSEKCPVCGSDLTDRLFEQNKISDLKEDVDS